jgi:hypothetical protein
VVSFTPRPLYPQKKSPWFPLDRGLGGPQSRSGRGGEEKNSQLPPGIELYELVDRGSRVRFPAGAENFPPHHPASYSMGTRGSFPGGKAARA